MFFSYLDMVLLTFGRFNIKSEITFKAFIVKLSRYKNSVFTGPKQ